MAINDCPGHREDTMNRPFMVVIGLLGISHRPTFITEITNLRIAGVARLGYYTRLTRKSCR